jgi:VWFA-related protein
MRTGPPTGRVVAAPIACVVAASIGLGAQKPIPQAQQGTPTFRTGIDVSRTTVRVLDKNRQPVRGLTAADFTVLLNGVEQPIVTVVAEDEPGPITPSASWMRDIAPDVASNDLHDPRLVVIIMDDVTDKDIPLNRSKASPYQVAQSRLVARTIIDELGPNDLASIVFSGDNRGPQDFTGDRARLLAAVDRYHVTELHHFTAAEYTRNVIQMALEFLRQVPERRSVILWISDSFPGPDEDLLPLDVRPVPATSQATESLQGGAANVPVFTISTRGFTGGAAPQDDERTIPGRTGGRTIAQTNTPAAEISTVFRELSVAYTVGFQQAKPESDGRFRRVEVRVNRPDVTIEPAQHRYFPTNAKRAASVAAAAKAASPATLALSGIVPLPDEPLRLTIAPFANPDATDVELARVAVALGVDVPFEGRMPDTVDLEVRVFDAEGRRQVDEYRATQVLRPRGGRSRGEFDLFWTLTLKPGRYNIRASMYSTLRESAGSVYTDFVVPDFGSAPLALSGLVMATVPEKPSLPAGEFRPWLPVVPTTTRSFVASERAGVFMRVYAGGAARAPIAIRAEIRDARDAIVFTKTDTLTPEGDTPIKSADYHLAVPIGALEPGEYLLSVVARSETAGESRRDVRFTRQ